MKKRIIIFFVIIVSFSVLQSCGFMSRQSSHRSVQTVMPESGVSPSEGTAVPEQKSLSSAFPIDKPNEANLAPKIETSAPPPQKFQPSKKKNKDERARTKQSVTVHKRHTAQKSFSLAELRQKYNAFFKVAGSASEKKVALTFDDGPDNIYTRQVLDILKKNNVKATFFVIGSRAKAHPDLIARMVREGHIIGNHSYSHANLPRLSEPKFANEIENTQSILTPMLGYKPRLFRPPYGAINEEQVRWAMDHGFLIVNWNVDSLDWKGLSAEKVSQNILTTTRPGSIILQHCGGNRGEDLSGTVKALPAIIQKLKNQGYKMVTVPELLHVLKNK